MPQARGTALRRRTPRVIREAHRVVWAISVASITATIVFEGVADADLVFEASHYLSLATSKAGCALERIVTATRL